MLYAVRAGPAQLIFADQPEKVDELSALNKKVSELPEDKITPGPEVPENRPRYGWFVVGPSNTSI